MGRGASDGMNALWATRDDRTVRERLVARRARRGVAVAVATTAHQAVGRRDATALLAAAEAAGVETPHARAIAGMDLM